MRTYDYNHSHPFNQELRHDIIQRMFSRDGKQCWIDLPINITYGTYTSIGDNFMLQRMALLAAAKSRAAPAILLSTVTRNWAMMTIATTIGCALNIYFDYFIMRRENAVKSFFINTFINI